MNKKESEAVRRLVQTCAHVMNAKAYKRITEALVDLNSKNGNMRAVTWQFERDVEAVAKLVGMVRVAPFRKEAT